MTTKPLTPGKWAEQQAQEWLEAKSSSVASFAWHRYPDAKAARGALAAQPADFLVGYPLPNKSPAYHLEVKETAQENRLPKAKVSQYGKLKMFDEAGFNTIVLVYRSAFKDWLYLRRRELFYYDTCPPSFPFEGRPTFPTAAAALEEIFK